MLTEEYNGYLIKCGTNPNDSGIYASWIYLKAMEILPPHSFVIKAAWNDGKPLSEGIEYAKTVIDKYRSENE